VDLDEFKRVARSPSEAEQWAQNMPLAGLLAHSLKSVGLKDLAELTEEQIDCSDCLVRLVKDKIQLLKQATNDRDRPTGFNLNFRILIFCLQKF